MHGFNMAEMIPLAKREHAGPREECVQEECYKACGSIHIKWMDSCIERVLKDDQEAANKRVPRWFRYISD
jgi:hypothetical protein